MTQKTQYTYKEIQVYLNNNKFMLLKDENQRIPNVTLKKFKETFCLPRFRPDSPIQLIFKFGQRQISLGEEAERTCEAFLEMSNGKYGKHATPAVRRNPVEVLREMGVRVEQTMRMRIYTGDYHIPSTFISRGDYCQQFITFYEAEAEVLKLEEPTYFEGTFTFNGCEQSDITKRLRLTIPRGVNLPEQSVIRL